MLPPGRSKEGAVVTCEVYEVIPQLKSGGTSHAVPSTSPLVGVRGYPGYQYRRTLAVGVPMLPCGGQTELIWAPHPPKGERATRRWAFPCLSRPPSGTRLPFSFPSFDYARSLPSLLPGLLRVVVVGGQVVLYCLCRPFIHSTHLFILSHCCFLICLRSIPESLDPTIHQPLGFFFARRRPSISAFTPFV